VNTRGPPGTRRMGRSWAGRVSRAVGGRRRHERLQRGCRRGRHEQNLSATRTRAESFGHADTRRPAWTVASHRDGGADRARGRTLGRPGAAPGQTAALRPDRQKLRPARTPGDGSAASARRASARGTALHRRRRAPPRCSATPLARGWPRGSAERGGFGPFGRSEPAALYGRYYGVGDGPRGVWLPPSADRGRLCCMGGAGALAGSIDR
jgi:hypothetical protein